MIYSSLQFASEDFHIQGETHNQFSENMREVYDNMKHMLKKVFFREINFMKKFFRENEFHRKTILYS